MFLFSYHATGLYARRLRLVSLLAAAALAAGAPAADAQGQDGRRARLSTDLAQRLQAGDSDATAVILTGSQGLVDDVAARHGLLVRKRLRSGALLEVPAYKLEAVAADADVDHLSGNHIVAAQMGVTLESIGADQVQ